MSDIRKIWFNQSISDTSKVFLKTKIDDIKDLNCFVGTIGISGSKVFILEFEKDIELHQNYLNRFIGVEIQVLQANNHSELVIILLENDLTEIFECFIEDIVNDLIPIRDQTSALVKISTKINYWKRLFSRITGDLLSPQIQRGLYGELYFLKELLERDSNHSYIINGWQGPEGANQDFGFNGIAIEIKTSKSNKPALKISNEYQLDNTGLTGLYVMFYKLNEYPGSTDTLYKLIISIRQKIIGDTLIQFNEKIINLGIHPDLEEEYNNVSFNVAFERLYEVTKDFPKIIRSNINNALSAVSYEIDPKLCTAFEIDTDQIFNLITNGNT